jgi:Fe-S cluster assembly protein SufD
MSASSLVMEQYQEIIGKHADDLAGNALPWLKAIRQQAAERFAAAGFPSRKQEAWRYSNVDSLLAKSFVYPQIQTSQEAAISDSLLALGESTHRIVFVNGRYSAVLSDLSQLSGGVYVSSLQNALAEQPDLIQNAVNSHGSDCGHVFNDLNTALFNNGLVLHVQQGQHIERPIELVYVTTTDNQAYVVSPRNIITLENGAKATLIERYVGEGESHYFNNGVCEVILQEAAELTHYRLQEESRSAYHISTLFIQHEANSRYHGNNVVLGACWSRTDYNVNFQGEYAESALDGLYLVNDKQLADMHLHINHAVPHCSSQQDFKGILLGTGRGVFDGLIEVAKQAQKTSAHLSNANLMLSRSAEIDTKPQLLIYADDVKCSHGATVGQLEPEQLFYLRSRGISEGEAKKMLCLGFAQEILERCKVEGLRERAELALRTSLEKTTVVE